MHKSDFGNPVPSSRRKFLQTASSAAALALAPLPASAANCEIDALPAAFSSLKPLGSRVTPIQPPEYQARIEHARELMSAEPRLDAIFCGPGSSLFYFTGIRWGISERLFALLIPRAGEPVIISPAFEEGRARERLRFPIEVRVWQEDESPGELCAKTLLDRGIRAGRIGIEEACPYTFFGHFRAAATGHEFVSADPVTVGCRGVKSAHELDLIRIACEATFDVFRAVFASLKPGMSQSQIGGLVENGFAKMDLRGDALVLLGASAALPHGSLKPTVLQESDVVLIDGGCILEGYHSDITRTISFGKPSEKVARAFQIVRHAQDAALDAARAGKFSGSVDDAARKAITSAGYGPGYKFFTHRLGHGIGLDEHEHPYLVRGSKTVLAAGMSFSDEPGIYVPGEFGVRCEDLMAIAPHGPAHLLTPGFAPSIEKPFA
jgi:Xaa-Pro aminopeptidase